MSGYAATCAGKGREALTRGGIKTLHRQLHSTTAQASNRQVKLSMALTPVSLQGTIVLKACLLLHRPLWADQTHFKKPRLFRFFKKPEKLGFLFYSQNFYFFMSNSVSLFEFIGVAIIL